MKKNNNTSQLKQGLTQATDHFNVQTQGDVHYNWNRAAVSSKIYTDEQSPAWLRIQYIDCTETKDNQAWSGELDAQELEEEISKPKLLDCHDWQVDKTCWRALMLSYIDEKFCSPLPIQSKQKFTPTTKWFNELKNSLVTLSNYRTDRITITQENIDEKIKKTFGINIDTAINEWITIHGDLHWANLAYPKFYILDWEVWGQGPLGYDPALLLAFSANDSDLVRQIRTVFSDWLSTRDGKIAQLFALSEVLNIAKFDSQFSRLEKPVERLAEKIINELKKKN